MTASRLRNIVAGLLGLGLCAALAVALIPGAQAKAPKLTLKSESVASVNASVLADQHGRTLYRLKPETSKHLLCSSRACLSIWPAVTVASKSTHVGLPAGVKGAIGFLRRGTRYQVTFRGLPLYRYSGDSGARQANGQHIRSFGGTWGVLVTAKKKSQAAPAPPPSPSPY
jgi:predicted lipoprotein with Yx(FWY)xxD motif